MMVIDTLLGLRTTRASCSSSPSGLVLQKVLTTHDATMHTTTTAFWLDTHILVTH